MKPSSYLLLPLFITVILYMWLGGLSERFCYGILLCSSNKNAGDVTKITDKRNHFKGNISKYVLRHYNKEKYYGRDRIRKIFESEPVARDKHIFFIETRCILRSEMKQDKSGFILNKRQACSVESAARTNPDQEIYVLYSCPITGDLRDSDDYVKEIFKLGNVKIWNLNVSSYFATTPLANWNFEEALKTSQWPIAHSSDIIRLVTLWKYGGTYLDLDVLLLKSVNQLGSNYVGKQDKYTLANGVINFGSEGLGHYLASACLFELMKTFRGEEWSYNGPQLVTRMILRTCRAREISELPNDRCKGFQILPINTFYAIPYTRWKLFFNEKFGEEILKRSNKTVGIHLWNRFSKKLKALVGSKQAYSLLASKYCPQVYSKVGRFF